MGTVNNMNKNIRLVLVSCCAPCSAGAIRQLVNNEIDGVTDFVVLFFNPNIFPMSEYNKRLAEQIKYCQECGAKYEVLEYDHDAWRNAVRGFETEPERGKRCTLCFEYRFRRAVKYAQDNGYNAIASVLGVSRHKSQSQVDNAARQACTDVLYLPIMWDENLRVKLNRESDFYRQNYCGCEFSIRKV